jgi:Ca-activated chloride channel family protein
MPTAAPSPTPLPQGEIYAYRENFFKNYGINPFVETATDRLSTFAADVDTASYTLMRRTLEQNKLPEPASVRTEEFLNYFNYHYPQPTGDKFAIHTEMAPSYFGDAQTKLLRVGIQGQDIMPRNRKAAHLTLVIDVSGSMNQPRRLDLVRQSLPLLVNQLGPNDKVGIVVYGNEARTLLPHTDQKQAILNAIATLRPEGGTNAEAGLLKGFEEAAKVLRNDVSNRILLCSDGVANVGATGPDAILARIKREAEKGIALSTVGFGLGDYNDTLMEQLANQGDGTYAYVDTLAEAQRIFVQNLTGTLQTIAKDVKIQVDFNPSVVAQYRLLGYENRDIKDSDFRNDAVDAGEVGSNHSVTALYELRFHSGSATLSEQAQVANVVLRYKDVERQDRIHEMAKRVMSEELRSFENTTASFKLATAAAEYAEILRKSIFAQDSQLKDVSALAQAAFKSAELAEPKLNEFVGLLQKAEQLYHPPARLSIASLVSDSQNPRNLNHWTDFLAQQLGGGGQPLSGR